MRRRISLYNGGFRVCLTENISASTNNYFDRTPYKSKTFMNSIEMHMVAFADKITIKRQSRNHTQESCFYESVINAQIASL